MADLFLSYAREDRQAAAKFARALEAKGWSAWWDQRIQHGKDFQAVIEEELQLARCIVVLWSKSSVSSDLSATRRTKAERPRLARTVSCRC